MHVFLHLSENYDHKNVFNTSLALPCHSESNISVSQLSSSEQQTLSPLQPQSCAVMEYGDREHK